MTHRQRDLAFVGALGLVALVVYLPALHLGWVWDDIDLVQPSPALHDFGGLLRALASDLYRQANPRLEASPYWRPLALASFWFDTRLGSAPWVLHAGNVLLHGLATTLLAVVLWRRIDPHRTQPRPYALAMGVPVATAALWFALHPENVEVVAWISCRYDLLCGVALLGILALPPGPGALRASLHGMLFLAGLLSKDGFAPMLAVVFAMDWASRRSPAQGARRWIATGAALAVWATARASLALPSLRLGSPVNLIVPFLNAVSTYFVRAAVPPPLTTGHAYAPSSIGTVAGVILLLGILFAVYKHRTLAVPAAIYLAGLVPAAVSMSQYALAPERYFYVPSMGLALFVGDLVRISLASQQRPLRWVPVLVGLAIALGLVRVERRLPDWQNDNALFAAALRVNPSDPQANLQTGIEAGKQGNWGDARRRLGVAARGNPGSARIASAYAWVLLQSGDFAGAKEQAQKATQLLPTLPDAWLYLARARHHGNDHAGELGALEKLLQLSPDFPGGLDAWVAASRETPLAAIPATDLGSEAPPLPDLDAARTWFDQARARHQKDDHAGELAALDEVLKVAPDFPGALGARAIAASEVALARGDVAGAIAEAERVTRLMPSLPEAWSTLAFARHMGGDHAGELSAIDQLKHIAPDFPGIDRVRALAACEANGEPNCAPGPEQP